MNALTHVYQTPEPEEQKSDGYAGSRDEQISDLKCAINNLLWMYAPATLTLGEADERAGSILDIVRAGPRRP